MSDLGPRLRIPPITATSSHRHFCNGALRKRAVEPHPSTFGSKIRDTQRPQNSWTAATSASKIAHAVHRPAMPPSMRPNPKAAAAIRKIKARRPSITSKKGAAAAGLARALAERLPFFPTERVEADGGADDAPARRAGEAEQRRRQQQQEINELTQRCERPPSHSGLLSIVRLSRPSDLATTATSSWRPLTECIVTGALRILRNQPVTGIGPRGWVARAESPGEYGIRSKGAPQPSPCRRNGNPGVADRR